MVKPIVRDVLFLRMMSAPAMPEDVPVVKDMLDTLRANSEHCVGLAANMIGVRKRIIVFSMGSLDIAMLNPVIIKRSKPYLAEEGCLSLVGKRETTRFDSIVVEYQDAAFQTHRKPYSGWIAQIIQHEIDHCDGIVI